MADKLYYDDYRYSIFFDPTPGHSGYYFVTDNHLSLTRQESVSLAIQEAEQYIG